MASRRRRASSITVVPLKDTMAGHLLLSRAMAVLHSIKDTVHHSSKDMAALPSSKGMVEALNHTTLCLLSKVYVAAHASHTRFIG